MKRLALALAALACLGADWPQKGDTVYVPGELAGTFGAPPIVQFNSITVPACAPLALAFSPKPNRIYVQDAARGATFKLCEGWQAWVVQSRDACTAAKPITFEKKDGCYSPAH